MSKLNGDILYLIFKELRDSKQTLHSYLFVNKTWCEIIVPIFWNNPWENLNYEKMNSLFYVIISHLSDESRNNLNQKIKFLKDTYQKPLFNYITFCKHLNFEAIERIINYLHEKSEIPFIRNVIFNLFINENIKFTYLYIPRQLGYQIHLIPGAKHCFSELEFISCYTNTYSDVLNGLTEICKSVKELKLFINRYINNYGIIKLIKSIKRLSTIQLLSNYTKNDDKSFCEILENSLIQHAKTIQCFTMNVQPVTKFLSLFVNLKKLELGDPNTRLVTMTWNQLENISLPFLQILKAYNVPNGILASLIENTSGYLTVIKIDHVSEHNISNKRFIQAIYQNCPKLKNLKLLIIDNNILELEKLLISCQCLNKLYINLWHSSNSSNGQKYLDWNDVFEILIKLSPTSLFNFKFSSLSAPPLSYLKLFFDNWKGRHPMLLKLSHLRYRWKNQSSYKVLLEKYKAEGIIEKYESCIS
ncbi:hypothetical protein C1645_824545 [Glomus cerebriforme]|uniref:F-box domain-containing protein n=1 Tax=Glomus cerebriforme TaxID=658196 RepID=A0A397SU15_9GLOM|nr:hypothetical protein C1645_824545 [Glomus cerebriforme]